LIGAAWFHRAVAGDFVWSVGCTNGFRNDAYAYSPTFTATVGLDLATTTESIGIYDNPLNPVVAQLTDATGSVWLATSSPSDAPLNSEASVSFSWPTQPHLAASTTYRLFYYPARGSVKDGGGPLCDAHFIGAAGPFINFVFPTNGTTTPDFSTWILDYNLPSASDTALVSVFYNASGALPFWDWSLGQPAGEHLGFLLTKKFALLPADATSSVSITATATLYDETLGYTAASSTITFTASPSVVSAALCNLSDGTLIGSIKQAICEALAFVFMPSQSSINTFLGLGNIVANKPPFGYFNSIKTSIAGLNNASTTAFIDASGTAAMAPIFGPVRTTFTGLIWFLFAWWLIHRIRKIEF